MYLLIFFGGDRQIIIFTKKCIIYGIVLAHDELLLARVWGT